MIRKRSIVTVLAGAAVVPALVLSACGDDDDSSSASATTQPETQNGQSATVDVAKTDLGNVLVDAQGRTLYLFLKDTGKTSECSGECATNWPPLEVSGTPTAGQGADASMVATSARLRRDDPGHLQRAPGLHLPGRQEGRRHEWRGPGGVRRRLVRALSVRGPGLRLRIELGQRKQQLGQRKQQLRGRKWLLVHPRRPWPSMSATEASVTAAFVLGALMLAGEAAVHVQQYASVVHGVRWIGPLFLANAAACLAAIAGLAYPRTRQLAASAGVVISVAALASLAVAYGRGLFGYFEGGFRTAILLAVITEVGAVVLLSAALAATAAFPQAGGFRTRS